MTSWRDTATPLAQDDLDGLLGAVLPFALEALGKHGEFFPFGATIGTEGQLVMVAADPGLGDKPSSGAVLGFLYENASLTRDSLRASAYVADVRIEGGDAVRVELEHAEGASLTVIMPYARTRFRRTITTADMRVQLGTAHAWI